MRRGQGTEEFVWSVSGECGRGDDGCVTSDVRFWQQASKTCTVTIDPVWTGVVSVAYMNTPWDEHFFVDGDPVNQAVHGTAPRDTLVWSGSESNSGSTWRICPANALPAWEIEEGTCYIDREGCFASEYYDLLSSFCGHSQDICSEIYQNSLSIYCVMNFNSWQV